MANKDNQEKKIPFEPKEMKIIESTDGNFEEHKKRMEEMIAEINKLYYKNDASIKRIKSRTMIDIIQIRGVQFGKKIRAIIKNKKPLIKKKSRKTKKTKIKNNGNLK